MKKIKYIVTIFLSGLLLIATSCRDDMAKSTPTPLRLQMPIFRIFLHSR